MPAARYTASTTSMFAMESEGGVRFAAASPLMAARNAFSWYQYVALPLTFSRRFDCTPDRGSRDFTVTRWKYWGPVMLNTDRLPRDPTTSAPTLRSRPDHNAHSALPVRPSANRSSAFAQRSTPSRIVFASAETTSGSAPASVRSWWIA